MRLEILAVTESSGAVKDHGWRPQGFPLKKLQ